MCAISSGRQIPREVSNPMVRPARNRDRQCRCFTRCSTSMTIAGNFVRSVCVSLARLSPPPPPIPRNPFSFTSPFIPPCIPLSRRSWTLHSILAGSEFVRGGNLFSVTSRRCRAGRRALGPLCFARTHHAVICPGPDNGAPGLGAPRKRELIDEFASFLSFPFSASPRLVSLFL